MVDVAILTPDPAQPEYADKWQPVLGRLQQALTAEGIRAIPTPWTEHVTDAGGLRGFPLVLPLLVWSYHEDHARWLQACRTWLDAGVAVANPPDVLVWNSDKRYLVELEEQGVAIPRTAWVRGPDAGMLERFFEETGAEELIIKPSVSGGAWKTLRFGRESIDAVVASFADDGDRDLLVQPFLPTIASEGETSLLYFGGRLSHVVNKRPVPGDFRVQEMFGGQYTRVAEPPAGAVELAECTLDAIARPLAYARIDMVRDEDGRWLLMEAELIEPDLYLGQDPRRGAGFAEALHAMI